MDHYDISERFAQMWRSSRAAAGKSQEYMARALGVSKKTIQNWEEGTSCPSQMKGFEWFTVLGLHPLPYYLQLLYPEEYADLSPVADDAAIEEALLETIRGLDSNAKRKLLFILYGDSGSSPRGLLELITAYLHTPLKLRINVAGLVLTNYEISKAHGEIVAPEHVLPNEETLRRCLSNSLHAVLNGSEFYNNTEDL